MKMISAAICGISIFAGVVMAAAPGSRPATTTTSVPASRPALLADTILKSFPANANGLVSRIDAKNLTIEGRVREIVSGLSNIAKPETRIILVGSNQSDEIASHITCHLDSPPDDLKIDQIIRITGTAGPAAPAAERVDLNACHDLVILGPPTVGNRLVGLWRAEGVLADGMAMKRDATIQGKKSDDIPAEIFASTMRVELNLKNDGTLMAELWSGGIADTLVKRLNGKWLLTKDGEETARVRLDIAGNPPADAPATFDGAALKLTMPNFADKRVLPDLRFDKQQGVRQNLDAKVLKNQILAWINNNCAGQPQQIQGLVTGTSSQFDASQARNNWYTCIMGSAITKRGKATALVSAYGKFTVLEFNDAQTLQNASGKLMLHYGEIPGWGKLMVPEVKVEAISFDKKGPMDLAAPITGKLTLRALRRMPASQYVFSMGTMNSLSFSRLTRAPGADADVFTFQFDSLKARLPEVTSPVVAVFALARQPQGSDPRRSDGTSIISEPLVTLVDLMGK